MNKGSVIFAMSLLAGALALAPAEVALAHGETVESRPAPGEVLESAPADVELRMTAALGEGSFIQVLDSGFQRVEAGETQLDPDSRDVMRVSLTPLQAGDYTVQWTAVDALDGHRTHGSYSFTVGAKRADPLSSVGIVLTSLVAIGALTLVWRARRRRNEDVQ